MNINQDMPRRAAAAFIAAATWITATPLAGWAQSPVVSPAPMRHFEYDAEGRMTLQNNASESGGSIWRHGYDKLGRRIQSLDALQGLTRFQHDAMDGLQQVTDPRGLVTTYARDGFGNMVTLSSPDTGVSQLGHDAAGNLLWRQTAGGGMATFKHDALNRLVSADHRHPAKPARLYEWFYDQTGAAFGAGIGRLTSIAYPEFGPGGGQGSASTGFGYSAEGWLMWQQQRPAGSAAALTVSYARSAAGTVTGITYPSGMRVLLDLDGNGRPSALRVALNVAAQPAPLLTQITHRPFADQDSEAPGWIWNTAQGQQVHPRIYDTAGRMIGYRLGSLLRELQYDAADRITATAIRDFATQVGRPSSDRAFQYSPTDWLRGGGFADAVDFSLGYDKNGSRVAWMKYQLITTVSNRLTIVSSRALQIGAATISPTSNRLLETSAPRASYRYDDEGNLQSDSRLQMALVHAADGRLASATQASTGQTAFYSYNNFGQRTRKALASGEQRLFVYGEQGELLGEYTAALAPVREYIWLGPTPVAVVQGGEIYTIHADHLGAPRVVLDTWGRQRWTWLSDPFGETPPVTDPEKLAPFDLPLRFPGQYADAETGYWFNWHRYYDPIIGRYIQSDPIGLAGGINTYTYVENNPLSHVDPMGLFKIHGNWCGPNWTGGQKHTYAPAADGYYKPAVDATDAACRRHDVGYYLCRQAFPCDKQRRGQCMTQMDRGLANEVRFNSGGASLSIYSWMNNNTLPDPGDDAPSCICTGN